MSAIRNLSCGNIVLLLLLICTTANAQRKISADVEVKQAISGKVMTITKSVYCANNGRLVVHFHTPDEFYVTMNQLGEARMYNPRTKESEVDNESGVSAREELLYLFMTGRSNDLGLAQDGYKLTSTVNEDGFLKKIFTSATDGNLPKVEVVYQNYLPIYMAYLDVNGKAVNKTYLSNYTRFGRFTFPCRVTNITYPTAKDSSVVRTIYSNVKVDVDDPMFDFDIPSVSKH